MASQPARALALNVQRTRLQSARVLLLLAAFFVLPFLLYGQVTLGSRTMLPADNLFQWQPWASHAAELGVGTPQNHLLSDLILQNYPWKRFVRDSLSRGEIPLWNPDLFAGVPFLAAGQHGMYYPFSLLFLLLPLGKAYGWYTVSQLWLAGVLMFVAGRVLGLRRPGAFLAGLVYQGCGFLLVSAAVFPMILGAAVWLPLLLACLERVVRRATQEGGAGKTLPWAALGAIALGLQILAGHIEITYYTLLVMAAFALWRLLGRWLATRRQGHTWLSRFKPAAWLAGLVIAGIMLGSIQWLPFYEVGQSNFRAGAASLEQVRGYGFPNRRLLTLALPNFFGNPSHHGTIDVFSGKRLPFTSNTYGQPNPRGAHSSDWGIKNYVEGGIYLGILALWLAALGIWSGLRARERRGNVLFFLLLALFSLAFIFGTPLYALLYYGLPGINQLHSPFRWVFPLSASVALLAGFGADNVLAPEMDRARRRVLTLLAGLSLGGGLVVWLSLLLSRLFYGALEPLVERLFLGLALAPEAFPDGRTFYSYEFWQLLVLGAWLLAAGLLLWAGVGSQRGRRRLLWVCLAALLIIGDAWQANRGFHAAVDPALLTFKPEVVAWLQAQPGLWRLTTFDPKGEKPLNANAAWPYGLQDVRGYESVIPMQYTRYMAAIEPQNELQFNRVQPVADWAALNSPLLDLLGVKYVLTQETLDLPKLRLAWQGEGLRVYENLAAVPRAYTLPASATTVSIDPLAAMTMLDPRQYVIIDQADWSGPLPPSGQLQPAILAPAEVTAYGNVEVMVQATVAERAWLVLNDSYAPGWRAFVRPAGAGEEEEQEAALVRVNGNFRGVLLDAGTWQVRFRYSPLTFKLGGLISFMGGIIILFATVVWGWRQFYPRQSELTNTRSIAKNSLAPMTLNLFNRAIDFVFAAFYLRLLGPGDAGSYATAITIASLYEIIANWGLNTLVIREVSQDKGQASRYLLNTSLLRLGTGLFASLPVAAYLLGRLAMGSPMPPDTLAAILLLMVGMVFSGMGQGLTGLFYAFEQAEVPAAVTTVTTILKVGFGVVVLLLGWGFVGLAGVSILVNAITLLILVFTALRQFALRGPWRVDLALQRRMIGDSYPLMLNHLLATVFFLLDVPLLQQIKGDQAVGWYDSAYKYIKAFNIIPAFFTFALFPVISRQVKQQLDDARRTFRLSIKLLLLVALPLAAVTTLLAHLMIGLLGGDAFLPDGAIALRIMVWSIPFGWMNSVTNYVLIALGQERVQTRAFALGVGFNLLANILFMPLYGYRAAAVITIASEIVLLLVFNHYLVPKMPGVGWLKLLGKPVAATVGMVAAMGLGAQVSPWLGLLLGLLVYPAGLVGLHVFGAEERDILARLVPASLSARLRTTP